MSELKFKASEEVRDALENDRPIVALESTVYSHLGLPSPHNETALETCVEVIRDRGAVPAVTAVIDGRFCLGLEKDEHERILGPATKTAERDLPVAVGQRWAVGATTVSASLSLASAAGIEVFATGGIGGVHREVEASGDVSADLGALSRFPLATVCAGAKSFLDLGRTLEALETLGVPVIGWGTDVLPSFTARRSPHPVPHRIDDLDELAETVRAQQLFGRGILITNPVPENAALDQQVHDEALDAALDQAHKQGITGAAVTPFVLDRMATASSNRSVPANVALVANNAALAAELAVKLRSL